MSGNEQLERELESFLAGPDSRLAALYARLPQPQPDAKLDAAVRAAAQRAIATTSRRARPRWLPALGVAAVLVIAASVAIRLGPQIWQQHARTQPAVQKAATQPTQEPSAPVAPAAPAALPPGPVPEPPAMSSSKPHRTPSEASSGTPAMRQAPAKATSRAMLKAPPPVDAATRAEATPRDMPAAFPKAPAQTSNSTAPVQRPAAAKAALQGRDNAEATGTLAAPASGLSAPARDQATAPAREKSRAAARPVHAYSAETLRNSHLYPESWLAAIRHLIREGREGEAAENIALFRQKYPDYKLPADIREFASPTQ